MATMITGGTGFLGSYLTRHLVHEKGITGKNLILFDRYPNKDRIADVLEQVILITGDITEPTELAAAMKTYEADQVYHLTAILGDPTSIFGQRSFEGRCPPNCGRSFEFA